MQTLISQIEALLDGSLHTLVDNHAQTYANVLVEHFEPTTPIRSGRGLWCEYFIRYRQLP
ncbi:unnamed protein product [marine sediment metagenome]|uniref:Uncharacterized protein n=1 Tax=marine sediment metagenome TaxID=412755 RepID=X1DVT2_9ZZZZ